MVRITIVIPTRNRDALAMGAVRALIGQGVSIFVSDNSDAPGKVRALCEAQPGVTYLRPPSILPMAQHWDWAVRQAMALSDATHFGVHYDRNVSKPGRWADLAAAATRHPDDLITYTLDNILFHPPPRRLYQVPWTGKLLVISARLLAKRIAAGKIHLISSFVPTLANCIVPRSVLDTFVTRFGSVCVGAGPDSTFMARFLALYERTLHFDCAIAIMRGSDRSAGLGFMRGVGGDFADFRHVFGSDPWLPNAPVAGLNIGFNLLMHDYETVRREIGEALPPIERVPALTALAEDLRWIADPDQRAALERILREHGWTGDPPKPFAAPSWRWLANQQRILFKARFFGIVPPTISGFAFRNDATAMAHAFRYPRKRQDSSDHLAAAEATELA